MNDSALPSQADPLREGATPAIGEPFRSFYAYYGETLCGRPVTDVVVESGRRCQYFENLALEEGPAGSVALKPLGRAWITTRNEQRASMAVAGVRAQPPMVDVADDLPRHPTRSYPKRAIEDIRYLVIHHTGASPQVDVRAIAEEHVRVNDWPGIGYHFVIDVDGTAYRTQDLTVASHHARQFNPAAVGIALVGDLSASLPTPDQLEATAGLVAWLLQDLGLGASSVRGHREMVATPCPGETFAAVWKPRLMSLALRRLAGEAEPEPGTDLLESEVRTPAELGTDSPTPELESPSEPGTDLPEPDVQAPSEPAPMPRHDAEHGQWPVPPPDESSTATEMAAQGPEPTPPQAIDSIEVESSAGDEDREPG